MSTQPAPATARPYIELIKVEGSIGGMPVGHRFGIKGRSDMDADELKVWAFRMLSRAMPDENPMCWKVNKKQGEKEAAPA